MSNISKIFIVVNLVLAVGFTFLTLSLYAERVNWKAKYETEAAAHKKTKAETTKTIADLKSEKSQLSSSLNTAKQTIDDLQQKLQEMETALKAKEEDKQELLAQQKLLLAKIQAKDEELNRRHNTIQELHKRITNQQKLLEAAVKQESDAIRMKIEAENRLKAVSEQLATALKEREKVESELAHATWTLDVLRERGIPIEEIVFGADTAVPLVEGQVLAVDPKVNLVMLSVGKDDKVEKGYTFSVYRGNEFVGKVRVTKVFDDMSAAVILDEYHRKDIQEGDHASTRLW